MHLQVVFSLINLSLLFSCPVNNILFKAENVIEKATDTLVPKLVMC